MSQSISSKVKTFFKSVMKPSPAAVFQAVKVNSISIKYILLKVDLTS